MLAQNESERSKLVSFGQTQQRSLYTFLWNLFLADASCLDLLETPLSSRRIP